MAVAPSGRRGGGPEGSPRQSLQGSPGGWRGGGVARERKPSGCVGRTHITPHSGAEQPWPTVRARPLSTERASDFLEGTQQETGRAGNGTCPAQGRVSSRSDLWVSVPSPCSCLPGPLPTCVTAPQPRGRTPSRYGARRPVLTTRGSETTWSRVTAGLGRGPLGEFLTAASGHLLSLFPSRLMTSLGSHCIAVRTPSPQLWLRIHSTIIYSLLPPACLFCRVFCSVLFLP